ncbi:hypothetical protein B7494_g5942 [Chlorociboria aeruginascens]|nr:hypothetical protein B7494_g5942 [Chlorociboria aeruginascens]
MAPSFKLPAAYTTFFLFLEPITALAGASYAYLDPLAYLQMTHLGSSPSYVSTIPLATTVVLKQLANLYLFFALTEALVLRSTSDLRVWRTLLSCMLLADFGHLYSVSGLGPDIYWQAWTWNSMHWGNVAVVYTGALMRMSFLSGIGLNTKNGQEAAARAAARKGK